MSNTEEDIQKEIRNMENLYFIKSLSDARGNGTSMISLIMPPTEEQKFQKIYKNKIEN